MWRGQLSRRVCKLPTLSVLSLHFITQGLEHFFSLIYGISTCHIPFHQPTSELKSALSSWWHPFFSFQRDSWCFSPGESHITPPTFCVYRYECVCVCVSLFKKKQGSVYPKYKAVIAQVRPPCVQRCISVLVVKSERANNSHVWNFSKMLI